MKKNLRRLGIICVLGVAIAAYAFHFHWRFAENRYLKKLRASGEKLTIAELQPPPVPEASNGAALFQQALKLISTNDTRFEDSVVTAGPMAAPGKMIVLWNQPDNQYFYPPLKRQRTSWDVIREHVESKKEAVQLLKKLRDYETIDFPIDYQTVLHTNTIGHLVERKQMLKPLAIAVLLATHEGDLQEAIDEISAMSAQVREAPDLLEISQLVRYACWHNTFYAAWQVLQNPNLTEAELEQMQTDMERIDFLHSAVKSIEMERATRLNEFARIRGSSEDFDGFWKSLYPRFYGSYRGNSLFLPAEQYLLQQARATENLGYANVSKRDRSKELASLHLPVDEMEFSIPPEFGFGVKAFIQSASVMNYFLDSTLRAETVRRLTITAIAIQRFQLKNGAAPEKLSALVPSFLSSVPIDPMDGKPLRYQKTESRFLLYSIGADGIDDGGDSSGPENTTVSWNTGKDLVWPSSATDEETALYYARKK